MVNKETVKFKSIPEMFSKEKSGRKPNTLRALPIGDEREDKIREWASLGKYGHIVIQETTSSERFVREITDITIWGGWVIISWKHPQWKKDSYIITSKDNGKEIL